MPLWEFQTGAGMNAPASTFEHAASSTWSRSRPATCSQAAPRGDSVWLFGLDGTLEPVPPGGALLTFAPGAGGTPNVANGENVFDTACMFCHGEHGEGGHGGGPTLQQMRNTAMVLQVASEGRNAMPAFGSSLTPEQIRDVAAYVIERLASPKAR